MLNLKTKEGYQNWRQNPKVTKRYPWKGTRKTQFILTSLGYTA